MNDDEHDAQVLAVGRLVKDAEYSELNVNGDAMGIAAYLVANQDALLDAVGAGIEFQTFADGTMGCRFATPWKAVDNK